MKQFYFTTISTAFLMLGCGGPAEQKQPTPKVLVAPVQEGPVAVSFQSVGTARAIESTEIASEVAGRVESVAIKEATPIETGDLLVQLDETEVQARLQSAQAQLKQAQSQLQRNETLKQRQPGAVSETELEQLRSTQQQAQAEVKRLKKRLDDHRLVAPFAGIVGLKSVSPGDYVEPGQQLTLLAQVDPIEVYCPVPSQIAALLQPEDAVKAGTTALPDEIFDGRIHAIDIQASRSTRTVTIVVRIDNSEMLLKPGLFLDVAFVVKREEAARLIPETAVRFRGTRIEAFVVDDENQLQRRDLTIGQQQAGVIEVLEGLEADEKVVTSDPQDLRQGMTVKAEPDENLAELQIRPGEGLPIELQESATNLQQRPAGQPSDGSNASEGAATNSNESPSP